MTVARKPVTGESTKEAVKTIACGDAGRFRCTRCCSCAFYQYKLHTRPRVHWAPGIPHALFGRKINAWLGRVTPRGREPASDEYERTTHSQPSCERSEAIHSFFLYAARWIASLRSQ